MTLIYTLRMTAEPKIKELITRADEAINRENFDQLMEFYSEDATLVVMPGKNACGKEQIRKAFVAIAEHFNHSLEVTQGEMVILEGGDTALVIANTMVRAKQETDSPYAQNRKATYVFRRQVDGEWLCVIDNSYGTDLMRDAE